MKAVKRRVCGAHATGHIPGRSHLARAPRPPWPRTIAWPRPHSTRTTRLERKHVGVVGRGVAEAVHRDEIVLIEGCQRAPDDGSARPRTQPREGTRRGTAHALSPCIWHHSPRPMRVSVVPTSTRTLLARSCEHNPMCTRFTFVVRRAHARLRGVCRAYARVGLCRGQSVEALAAEAALAGPRVRLGHIDGWPAPPHTHANNKLGEDAVPRRQR